MRVIIFDSTAKGAFVGNGYQAEIDALRSAAEAASSAAEQVSGVDLAGAVGEAGAGMPGARCVQAFERLGSSWKSEIDGWVAQADGYAKALTGAADHYGGNEQAAGQDFGALAASGGPG